MGRMLNAIEMYYIDFITNAKKVLSEIRQANLFRYLKAIFQDALYKTWSTYRNVDFKLDTIVCHDCQRLWCHREVQNHADLYSTYDTL